MTNRLVIIAALMLVLPLISGGCTPAINEGTIVDMDHFDSATWYTVEQKKIGNITIFQSVPHHVPEHWTITIEGQNDEGEVIQVELTVAQEDWDRYEVGGYYKPPATAEGGY